MESRTCRRRCERPPTPLWSGPTPPKQHDLITWCTSHVTLTQRIGFVQCLVLILHLRLCPNFFKVLLSQVHRLRALDLLGRFLDLGPWAVSLVSECGAANTWLRTRGLDQKRSHWCQQTRTLFLCGQHVSHSLCWTFRRCLLAFFRTFWSCYKVQRESCDRCWCPSGLKYWLLTAWELWPFVC